MAASIKFPIHFNLLQKPSTCLLTDCLNAFDMPRICTIIKSACAYMSSLGIAHYALLLKYDSLVFSMGLAVYSV